MGHNLLESRKYHPFSQHKLENDIPEEEWLLFLNPFDYRHNPSVF